MVFHKIQVGDVIDFSLVWSSCEYYSFTTTGLFHLRNMTNKIRNLMRLNDVKNIIRFRKNMVELLLHLAGWVFYQAHKQAINMNSYFRMQKTLLVSEDWITVPVSHSHCSSFQWHMKHLIVLHWIFGLSWSTTSALLQRCRRFINT